MTVGRPFQPGQSGNPGGRPKEIEGLAKLIRDELERDAAAGGINEAVKKALDLMRFASEPKDKLAAIKVLLEYGYGKPNQAIQHEVSESLGSLLEQLKQVQKLA